MAGGAYKNVLAKPGTPEPKPKVHGEIYVLPKEFLVNLADGRFAKLRVALGSEPQEAIVRDLITDTLTDAATTS